MAELISVIVPVYNIAEYLPRCLDSILMQTYPYIEIIAVDDGSEDSSGEVLDEYKRKYKNIRVIHKKNGGVTEARLTGVACANGKWIGFVDGDDEIEPDMYERLIGNANEYDAQISHCGYQMCFEDGRVHWFYNSGRIFQQDRIAGIKELLSGLIVEPGLWNKLFDRTLFKSLLNNAVMDKSVKINEDLLMNFYLFSVAERSVFEDWCPYRYFIRNSSASRVKLNEHRIYDPIRVKLKILEKAENSILIEAQRAYLVTCISVYNSIILEKYSSFELDRQKVRNMILAHKKWRKLLSKKQQILAILIQYMPFVYKPLYRFYASYILYNRYE